MGLGFHRSRNGLKTTGFGFFAVQDLYPYEHGHREHQSGDGGGARVAQDYQHGITVFIGAVVVGELHPIVVLLAKPDNVCSVVQVVVNQRVCGEFLKIIMIPYFVFKTSPCAGLY